ncbi:MAG: rod shape-determining protein RodA [Bacillota bacterium]|jgi:rod shape determining protein RodA
MGFDRKLLKYLDWQLWLAMLAISLFAVVVIRSASVGAIAGNPLYYVKNQIMFIVIGNLAIAVSLLFDYRLLLKLTKPIYLVNLGLLASVLLIGQAGGGAQRWVSIAGFRLQPSEFAKVFIIVVLAHFLESQAGKNDLKSFLLSGALVALPMGLILIQPDLGTSLVFIALFFGVMYAAGTHAKFLVGLIAIGLLLFPLIWAHGLQDYQRNRLLVFLDPEAPQYRAHGGYQVIQSMIAVGSGGLLGQGYMQGTQNTHNFLPEQHTDFIFSVLAEEFGFVGTLALIAAYVFLMQRILSIALEAKDLFGRLLAIGVLVLFLFQVFVNIGMTVGIMPVTGLPLPLVTAGGSSYLAFCMAIALVLNVGMRRQKILF